MSQSALGQLDYRIFKLNIPLEQNDEIAWHFTVWYQFLESEIWKILGVGVVKNGCGQSGHRLLKLALSQEGMIFHANLNSGKLKVILIIIEWASGQNRCGLLGHGTVKSVVSQEWFDESSWFFAC